MQRQFQIHQETACGNVLTIESIHENLKRCKDKTKYKELPVETYPKLKVYMKTQKGSADGMVSIAS